MPLMSKKLALALIVLVCPLAPICLPAQAPDTLHANARLVVVDVTVTDKQGHPIHNLKQSEFTLLEDKKRQNIKSFEEHSAAVTAKVAPIPELPPGVFSNESRVRSGTALNVLLLDTLNTPLQDQTIVRQQLQAYLDKQAPNANVAIFGLATHLVLLQDFTSNPELLKKAIKFQKGNASALLDAQVSGNDFDMKTSDRLMMGDEPPPAAMIASIATFEAIQTTQRIDQRARITLDAMNTLAEYLVGIPGRKNLVWFSGSFPFAAGPDPNLNSTVLASTTGLNFATTGISKTNGDPSATIINLQEEFRQTVDLLSESQVAVYPVLARGITAESMYSPQNGGANGGTMYTRNPAAFAKDQTADFTKSAGEDTTMMQIAYETGGTASFNNNLADAAAHAIENGSNYYTIAYTPSNDKWKGDDRQIQIDLAQKGYVLGYRRSYFADDPDAAPVAKAPAPAKKGADAAAAAPTPTPVNLQLAMKFGSPAATQIQFKVRVVPAPGAPADKPAPGNSVNPNQTKNSGPYQTFNVDYLAEAANVKFDHTAEGSYRDDLEFLLCLYSTNGDLINVVSTLFPATFTAGQYAQLTQRGLPHRQSISVPVKGDYLLRVAIHDRKTDHIGALELPIAAVKNLPPL